MKVKVTFFKHPANALQELEPFWRDAQHTYTTQSFVRLSLRSRKLVAD